MGKKIIITESQIESLKVLLEREMGIEESVLIAKKNPFKYEEFKNARRVYDSSMNDGDRFYTHDFEVYSQSIFKKILVELETSLNNKTIRFNDEIYSIKVRGFYYDTLPSNNLVWIEINFEWGISGPKITIEYIGNGQFGFEITGKYLTKTELEKFKEKLKPISQTINSVIEKNKFEPTEKRGDEFFEIREIKRENTDF